MKKTRIIFLLLPEVHLLDLAGPDQVFLEAQDHGVPIQTVYAGVTKNLQSSSQIGLITGKLFSEIPVKKGDFLIIPGNSLQYQKSKKLPLEKQVLQWIVKAHEAGAFICSVCTGAFFLAKTGLLDGKKCTTHWKRTKELQEQYPTIKVVEDILFTTDERILTGAGVASGIDLALYIITKLAGEAIAFTIARELVVYMRRQGNEAQHSVYLQHRNHVHSGIHDVQDFIQENINKKLSLLQLADIACMSNRNLTRIFKKETGITINAYITMVRKEVLRSLSERPDITRKQMAVRCGLKSERQVIRLLNVMQ